MSVSTPKSSTVDNEPPDLDAIDLTDLSSLTELAARAESLLLEWMRNRAADEVPPPIKDITSATQALWRLTAVRKTLLSLERPDPDHFDPDPDSNRSAELTDEEIEHLIRRGEEGLEDDDPTEADLGENQGHEPSLAGTNVSDAPESPRTPLLNLQSPLAPSAHAPPTIPAPRAPDSSCQSSVLDFKLPSRRTGAMVVPACPTIPAISIPGVQASPAPPAHTLAHALAPLPPAAPDPEIPDEEPQAALPSAPAAPPPSILKASSSALSRGLQTPTAPHPRIRSRLHTHPTHPHPPPT